MKYLSRFFILNLKRLLKQPCYLLLLLVLPLAVYGLGLLLAAQIQGLSLYDFGQYYFISAIVFAAFSQSYLYLAKNMSDDRLKHFDIVLKNHKKYFWFNLSYIVIFGLLLLVTSLLLFVFSGFYGGLVWSVLRYCGLLLYSFIGFIMGTFFAIMVSTIPRRFFTLIGYITLFIAFLSGVFLPMESIKDFAAPILQIIPIYNYANVGWQFIYFRIYSGIDFLFLGLWTMGFFSVTLIFYPQLPEYSLAKSFDSKEANYQRTKLNKT
ncbi:MAG: ABC transporter permease [Bifidobacteriaceae bacterium]|jgi:hypothetical protein|nr:ABC transporter permease [Bifidobacteriaceae bacterium]